MYLGQVMGEGLYYLMLISAVLFIIYLIITLAVKHAVLSILPKIKASFNDSISESITQYEWGKNKK